MEIVSLTRNTFRQSSELLFSLGLDSREEIDHHLEQMSQYFVALEGEEVIGVIGWYQDNVNYAKEAMGKLFPGESAYWVGFFGVASAYQNKGVGKLLIQHLENILLGMNVNVLWVSSVENAVAYYQKRGFQIISSDEILGNRKIFLKRDLKQSKV